MVLLARIYYILQTKEKIMYTHIKRIKELPVKAVKTVIVPEILPLIKKEAELEIFSEAWEWDQMCNHCVD
jgi:hypothetical protein